MVSNEEKKGLINNEILLKVLGFFRGIGTILLYFIIAGVASYFLSDYYKSDNKVIASLAQLGVYLILILVLGLVYHKRLINDFKKFKKENVNIALKNWLMGLGVMIISNLIITMIVGNISANESANRELLLEYPISNIITMIIIGPLAEEITFRASFKKAFNKWYTFALVTGFFFGFAHIAELNLLELLFIVPYGALGFFFAKAMYETDNIYTSFISHAIHNGLCVCLILLF